MIKKNSPFACSLLIQNFKPLKFWYDFKSGLPNEHVVS
jgi:hypothetical protein